MHDHDRDPKLAAGDQPAGPELALDEHEAARTVLADPGSSHEGEVKGGWQRSRDRGAKRRVGPPDFRPEVGRKRSHDAMLARTRTVDPGPAGLGSGHTDQVSSDPRNEQKPRQRQQAGGPPSHPEHGADKAIEEGSCHARVLFPAAKLLATSKQRPSVDSEAAENPVHPVGVPLSWGLLLRRRVLVLALLAVAVVGLAVVGVAARRSGTFSPNGWIRTALVAFTDSWLVPDVSLGGFSFEDPTTLALREVALTASGTEIFRCDRLAVTFSEVPERGQPLVVERVELDAPVLRLIFERDRPGLLPRGFSPLFEPSPEGVDERLQPRELLDLRLLRVRDGEVHIEDQRGVPLRLDGIDLDLDATPAVSPGGATGHQLGLSFGQQPGFMTTARGFVDLDAGVVDLAEARFSLDLQDPAARDALTEGFRAAVERLDARGRIDAEISGVVSWRDPLASSATLQLDAQQFEASLGPVRLPGIEAHLRAAVAEGRIRLERAEATVGEGRVVLSGGDLDLEEEGLAFAADWTVAALPLDALVVGGAATESVANGSGGLFLKNDPFSLTAFVNAVSVAEPGRKPTVELGPATVKGVHLLAADPDDGPAGLVVEDVRIEGVQVRLSQTPAGVIRGLPLPADPDLGEGRTQTSRVASRVQVRSLEVENGGLWVERASGPWSLTGMAGTVSDLGGTAAAPISLSLRPGGGAEARASGTLDLSTRRLHLTRLTASGRLQTEGLRSLFPPENRSLVAELLPRGRLETTGMADLHFGAGSTRIALDFTLTDGAVRLLGLTLPVTDGRARLQADGAGISAEEVRLAGARGTLHLPEARLSRTGDLAVHWDAQRLDLSRIATASGLGLGVGRLSSEGKVVGTFDGDALRQLSVVGASAVVDQEPAGQTRWPSVTLNVQDAPGGRAVTARIVGPPGAQLDLEAAWPAGSTDLVVRTLRGTVDTSGAGREALPVSAQRSLLGLQQGLLTAAVSGVVPMEDPIARSRLTGQARLTDGVYDWGDWSLPSVEATLPISLSGGTLATDEGRLALLSGAVELTRGRWSLLEDSGTVAARLDALRLKHLEPRGPAATSIEGRLAGQGTASLRLTEEGLTVTGGRATATVREGRLVSLPTLAALTKGVDEQDGPGDDEVDLEMVYDAQGVTFRSLDLDLGPVRYRGGGEVRWSGGLDLALEADRSRKRLADLAARLVAWRVGGTTARPAVQALPLGVDTRSFAQKRAAEGVDADALDGLDEAALDELETASDRGAAGEPPRDDDEVEFNLDDFDDWK